jgi:hypothetical protein
MKHSIPLKACFADEMGSALSGIVAAVLAVLHMKKNIHELICGHARLRLGHLPCADRKYQFPVDWPGQEPQRNSEESHARKSPFPWVQRFFRCLFKHSLFPFPHDEYGDAHPLKMCLIHKIFIYKLFDELSSVFTHHIRSANPAKPPIIPPKTSI